MGHEAKPIDKKETKKNKNRTFLHVARTKSSQRRVLDAKLQLRIKRNLFQLHNQVKQLKQELNDAKNLLQATHNATSKNNLELEDLRKLHYSYRSQNKLYHQNLMKRICRNSLTSLASNKQLITID
jgi:hypothetical protein